MRKLDALHSYDCLRANKSMMAWGVEARVPFLDLEFLDVAMGMDAAHKMAGDGAWRRPFCARPLPVRLPDSILWRQKEQFSDGVGYGWIDGLKAHAEASVSDRELASAAKRFPLNPPATKEALFLPPPLRTSTFPASLRATVPGGKSIACSSPRRSPGTRLRRRRRSLRTGRGRRAPGGVLRGLASRFATADSRHGLRLAASALAVRIFVMNAFRALRARELFYGMDRII